jgi:hypothetical protein
MPLPPDDGCLDCKSGLSCQPHRVSTRRCICKARDTNEPGDDRTFSLDVFRFEAPPGAIAGEDSTRSAAHRSGAKWDHNLEEPYAQPSRATLHRSCPQNRKTTGEKSLTNRCPSMARLEPPPMPAFPPLVGVPRTLSIIRLLAPSWRMRAPTNENLWLALVSPESQSVIWMN